MGRRRGHKQAPLKDQILFWSLVFLPSAGLAASRWASTRWLARLLGVVGCLGFAGFFLFNVYSMFILSRVYRPIAPRLWILGGKVSPREPGSKPRG